MKKNILLCTLGLFMSLVAHAQNQAWAVTSDSSNAVDIANATDIDNAGNRYVIGTYADTLSINGIGFSNFIKNGTVDGFVAKYSPVGNLLWVKTINGLGIQECKSIKVNRTTGECYVSGRFYNDFFIDGIQQNSFQYILFPTSSSRTFLIKLDASGNLIWSNNTYSVLEYPSYGAHSLAIAPDGNSIYFHTSYLSDVHFESGESYLPFGFGVQGNLLTRVDASTGSIIIARNDLELYLEDGYILTCDASGNVIWAGSHRRNCMADLDSIFLPCLSNPSYAIPQGFIWKMDENFNSIWGKEISGTGFEIVSGLTADNFNNIYAYGTFDSPTSFDATNVLPVVGKDNGFVVKLTPAGNYSYVKTFSADNFSLTQYPSDEEASFAVDKKGNVFFGGSFTGTITMQAASLTTESLISFYYSNGFICKLDKNGNLRWGQKFAGNTGPFDATLVSGIAVNGSSLSVCGGLPFYNAYLGDTIHADKAAFYLSAIQDCDIALRITASAYFVNAIYPVTLTAPLKAGYTYQWQKNNIDILGATSNTLITTTTGSYKCIITMGSCVISTNRIRLFLLIRESDLNASSFQIFPNPTSNYFIVTLPETNIDPMITITLTDVIGRKVYSIEKEHLINQPIEIRLNEVIPTGTYFINVKGNTFNNTSSIILE